MRLKSDDYIVGISSSGVEDKDKLMLNVSANGLGKFSALSSYRIQGRGGSGIKTMKINKKTGRLVIAQVIDRKERESKDLIATSREGLVIRTPLKKIPIISRNTQGVKIIRLKEGDSVSSGDIIGIEKEV